MYFDKVVRDFEGLMVEVSQDATDSGKLHAFISRYDITDAVAL